MKQHRAPLIVAIVLLLLPVLYVASYLVLVDPNGQVVVEGWDNTGNSCLPLIRISNYRLVDRISRRVYWPLEMIDRKVRPEAWEHHYGGISF